MTYAGTDTPYGTFTYHCSLLSLRTNLRILLEALYDASDCIELTEDRNE